MTIVIVSSSLVKHVEDILTESLLPLQGVLTLCLGLSTVAVFRRSRLFSGFVFYTLSSPLICFYYACQSDRGAHVVFIVLFCVDTTVHFIQRARLHAVAIHVLSLSNEPEIKITQYCSVQRQLQTVGCVLCV